MSAGKIKWDEIGSRYYETGVDHGVLYPQKNGAYPKGVAWNGLSSVAENPSGAEASAIWADNIKYLNMISTEELGLTIECYTTPDEWDQCSGIEELSEGVSASQQKRIPFGFSYRTRIGNDTKNDDYGYKLHLVYGCSATPSEKSYGTVNESPEAMSLSYTISTVPVVIDDNHRPTALIVIDSTKVDAAKLKAFEEILYGKDAVTADPGAVPPVEAVEAVDARLPLPAEVMAFFSAP